jgi:pimeloyl-[acyl-carrier protein] methyl ester esterase
MGALLAMEAALAQPASVRALVLIGGTPRFVSDDPLAGWPERVLRRMQRRLRSDAPAVLREFHARMFAPGEAPQAEEFAAAYPIPDAVNFSVEGLAAGLDYLAATDLRPGLVRLRCPVLWIHGGQDRICPLKALDGLPAEHRKRVVESAGHLPFWTHPEETAQAIREFRSHA